MYLPRLKKKVTIASINLHVEMQAGSVAAIVAGYPLIGSFLFCASLSHKQMSLYFAPAFFAHLLGTCLQRKGWGQKVSGSETAA